jgi:Mlc titration factor MtfA (ptsG expression regulator)
MRLKLSVMFGVGGLVVAIWMALEGLIPEALVIGALSVFIFASHLVGSQRLRHIGSCKNCSEDVTETSVVVQRTVSRPSGSLHAPIFSEEWETILARNTSHDRLLSEAQRARLRRNVLSFVGQKYWEGCAGLQITDEIQVTVAAQACLMLLGSLHDCFTRVQTILVYPTRFVVPSGGVVTGQAFFRGPVILAWDTVLAEGRNPSLGHNLVIHEFAHQLDMLDGYVEGTLDLGGEPAERWHAVLASEYTQLKRNLRKGRATFLGEYAASNKTEFFAVVSERFFTQPDELRGYHPSLYESLTNIYGIDPRPWFANNKEAGT